MAAERREDELSSEMIDFLKEQELETEIQMTIDAAREIGLSDFTREDAVNTLLEQEKERNVRDKS